jgi:hypothetical protein
MNEKEQIASFFKEYVFGFMCNDIERTMQQGCNFLCALGLVAYTEIMGRLVIGKLGEEGYGRQSFRSFLKYMGEKYVALDKSYDLYKRVRCGLIHEYFIVGPSTISMDALPALETGIKIDEKGITYFYVPTYFQNFKKAAERYLRELLEDENIEGRRKFLETIQGKVEDISKLRKVNQCVSGDIVTSFGWKV